MSVQSCHWYSHVLWYRHLGTNEGLRLRYSTFISNLKKDTPVIPPQGMEPRMQKTQRAIFIANPRLCETCVVKQIAWQERHAHPLASE